MAKDQLNSTLELPIKYKYLQSLRFFLNIPIKNLRLGRMSLGNPALWAPFSSNLCPYHVLQLRSKDSYTPPSASHPESFSETKTRWETTVGFL